MKWISLALVISFYMAGMIFLSYDNNLGMMTCFILMSFSALIAMACSLSELFNQINHT